MASFVASRLARSSCRRGAFLTRNSSLQPAAVGLARQERKFATSPSRYTLVDVQTKADKGIAIVSMNRKPVNGLSLELMTEMNIALEKLENDKTCRGYILTSALPTFCAGLEITEMYQPQPDRLRTFWRNFQDLALKLHNTRLVNIAAISGSAPAGGCALSLACDYRILADGKTIIGLNESLLGIVAPQWLRRLAVYTVGTREADKMLQLGTLFPPADALKIGLVDEVVARDQILQVAEQRMTEWFQVPDAGRQLTKHLVRKPFVDDFIKLREEDENGFVGLIMKDGVQKIIGMYLEALSKK